MKLWQLVSICKDIDQPTYNLELKTEWKEYQNAFNQYNKLVDEQDREILDKKVPRSLIIYLLSSVNIPLYIYKGHIQRKALSSESLEISVLDAYYKVGSRLEDVFEYGIVKI